ncbi:transforming growth factor beta-1-induced transcript 1 protein-like isoform X2 [Onychostoma macrolepis]|uniref:transforming growth factor beta-1-induced transcript 1 protein-like isoform X2 n=1 Tax=Onychostoma macrolepis TaxID=369639 RepID=UPI00272BB97E|nr:transforming growth factor beta-1-induced transcript 1 protein-like isoform X2 [Onychostoma macrolepis]
MDDLDALLADLENSAFPLGRYPVLLTSDPPVNSDPSSSTQDPAQNRPLPPAYTPQQTVSAAMKSNCSQNSNQDKLYSTVCKPRFPRTADLPPAFSSSSVLGGGLSELDHLLQELNATQFNITDEILSQFPSTKKDDKSSKSGPSSTGSEKPSATSATLELDKLMASLSDFRVQSTPSAPVSPVAPSPQQTASPPPASSGGSLDSMLGLLQSDLSRQGVPTSSKGNCSACQKPVVGQKMVTALDKNWHPECFSCVKCSSTFGDEGFHDREGKQYCQKCFLALFASRCQGCSQPIMKNYISALSVLWHPQCFVCRECYSPFVNGSFFEHEGQPLCEAHYHQSRGTVCQACQQPILGRCVTAMGAKFHPQHLVCHFCLKPLSKGCFKEQDNKPYCHPCFIKLFG